MSKGSALARIRRQRDRLVRRLGREGALMKGSLARRWVRCGRKGCRCGEGEKHGPYLYVSVFADGKTRSVYVPRRWEKEVRQWVANARALEADVAEITRLNAERLRLADKPTDPGVRPGRARGSPKSAR